MSILNKIQSYLSNQPEQLCPIHEYAFIEPHELAGAGGCSLCGDACTYPDAPCRHPDRARRSMEACGMEVTTLAKDCGIHYMNGENTVTYFSILFW